MTPCSSRLWLPVGRSSTCRRGPGHGYAFIELDARARGGELTVSWSDGPLNLLTGRAPSLACHLGWGGLGIRNGFGLWRGNVALLESCRVSHPDSCSSAIIAGVWEL